MITNKKIPEILSEFTDQLEIAGENSYRIRAYRRAAKEIANLSENVESCSEKMN